MTSLQGSLPDSASGLWRMDREYGVSNTRVKHIVIHEAHIRESPDRHVVYRIDVFTQERNWCVYRRYSEFRKLHDKISESFKMFKGSFPPKQLSGNLSPAIIEQRRSSLEHYLLKIVNCHNQDVSSCPTVLRFLDLHHNDVYYVTSSLCRYVKTFGEAILNEEHFFVLSPTQLFCVHKRLRIPNSDADYKADTVFCDLGSLYDFLGRLTKVCIKPASLQDQGIRSEILLLKNIKELQIQTFSVSLIKGLASVQLQIQRLKATQALTAMKDLLIDCVLERKTQPKQPVNRESVESNSKMRDSYNSKVIFNSYTIHPWISLLYLDLSHNTIRQLDDSFSLLPNLQELDLSYNQIEVLDLNFINPALTKLVCTHCSVMKVITKTHENLTELILSHNQLTELTGFNKIVMLKKLNLYSNSITSVDNIACLTDLPRLHDIDIAENPLSKNRSYRNKVLCMFTQACRRTDIIVDGKGFSEKEKKKAKNTRVKGTQRQGPSALPFFGSTSDQMPTAFTQEPSQEENHWNSILHDSSVTTTDSSHSDSEVEVAEEGEALSPALSEIRSTPSQTRTYDWDPAQAFASSAHSTPPPLSHPYLASPGGTLMGLSASQQGSSTCLDNTSSCECDDRELQESVTIHEYSSLEPVSPLEDTAIKNFNSSYYNLCGGSDLYSTPALDSSIDISGNLGSKHRVNPFGEPSGEGQAGGCNLSLSGSSKDFSDSSSEDDYNTCREESRMEESTDQERETGRLFEGMRIMSSNQNSTTNSTKSGSTSDFATPAPVLTPSSSSQTDIKTDDTDNVGEDEVGEDGLEASAKYVEKYETGEEKELTTSENENSSPAKDPDAVETDSGEQVVETFVVDRPDYDDIIFAGGTSPGQDDDLPNTENTDVVPQNSGISYEYNPDQNIEIAGSERNPSLAETPNFISNSPTLQEDVGQLLTDDSPVLARETPISESPVFLDDEPLSPSETAVLAQDSPSAARDSPVLARARDSPYLARDSPVSPERDRIIATDSPVSPGLTDHTSSGDECIARLNKIQSLSFSKDTDMGDLYDSEDSEEQSEGLSFSNSKLQF